MAVVLILRHVHVRQQHTDPLQLARFGSLYDRYGSARTRARTPARTHARM